jgi:alpha-tubulin suppressor-like RCC1 family protein/ATP-dependent protease HslVU (ClpYQ) peptidase subunit
MKTGKFAKGSFFIKGKVFLYLLFLQTSLNAQTVYPFAGSGTIGSANGAASAASFSHPSGVAIAGNGDTYVADYWNNKIRKITASGVVSTFAGSGAAGSANGAGAAASFNYPHGIAVDALGNVYVADRNNHKIRKITSAGIVTTLAGSGTSGTTNGTGAAASFNLPLGVAVDVIGNVYVTDGDFYSLIRKVTPSGVVTTMAGSGTPGFANGTGIAASFNSPHGVAVDNAGNVFVTDDGNNRIRKITSTGVVTTFAGSGAFGSLNGTGAAASFSYPAAITIDGAGNLYVADGNKKIRKITSSGVVTTFAGSGGTGAANGPALTATFDYVAGISINPSGEALFIADYNYHIIRRVVSCFSIPPVTPVVNVTQPTTVTSTGDITITSPVGAFEYSIDDINYQASTSFIGLTPGIFQVTARHTASIGCVSTPTTVILNAPVQPLNTIGTIAGGSGHSLFICNDGSIMTCGYNFAGQLGNGTNASSSTPSALSSINSIASVKAGFYHSLILKTDGTVWAWGYNSNGQLGDGTTTNNNNPAQVNGLNGIIAIAADWYHSLALKNDGTVWAWGQNIYGQFGNGNSTSSNTPLQITSLNGIIAIAAGLSHSLFLKNDGTLWASGNNTYGQLGNGTNTGANTPVQVNALTGVTRITTTNGHCLALKNDGTIWAWGQNSSGQLGNGNNTNSNVPLQVNSLTGITDIALGAQHSLALKNNGTVYAWGQGSFGILGNGTFADTNVPVQVSSLTGVIDIAGGERHSLARKTDGTVWAWGYNSNGQLGDGTNTNRSVPVQVINLCNGIIGIGENVKENFISVYPNPSNGIFQLRLDNLNSDKIMLEVYNACGEKVYLTSNIASQMKVDLSAQPKGIYFIKMYDGTNVYNKKIIIH